MVHHPSRITLSLAIALALTAVAQPSAQGDADSVRAKLAAVVATADRVRGADAPPVDTPFTEREVNAYLQFYGPEFLPAGITAPQVAFAERNRVRARAIVDLDAVRMSLQRDWRDPLAYLTGSLEVTAVGVVSTADGTGMARLESATVAGISVPRSLLQELVRYYTTTPERPTGFDLDQPFALPLNIRSVIVDAGRATIVQ